MKKKRRNKIFLLLIIILFVTIGFAILSTTLNINGTGLVKGNTWSVYWDNASVLDGSVSDAVPVIGQDEGDPVNTKATWSVTFTEPGQFYAFTIDAVNAGTMDAIIKKIDVTTSPQLPEYITYKIVYNEGGNVKENDLLEKGVKTGNTITPTRRKYRVIVEFSEDITPEQYNAMPDSYEYTFAIEPIYDQVVSSSGDGYTRYVTLKSNNENLKGKTDAELVEYYGSDVSGLSTVYPIDWQLFYSDSDYIYLITKDYVRCKYLPKELYFVSEDTDANPTYRVDFGKQIYAGSMYVTSGEIIHSEPWNAGSESIVFTNNPLTNKYLKWVSAYPDSKSDNIIATAYMMDTSIWANFAGDVEGAFAMGGPTLEMFIASYNSKFDDYYLPYDTIEKGTNAGRKGYMLNKKDGAPSNMENDNMWFISSKEKVEYYWLASPAAYNDVATDLTSHELYTASYGGYLVGIQDDIQYLGFTSPIGFRPLVAIPKSSLK